VREAFVQEYRSFVAVQAARSDASPLQLLMELVWSGCGPLSGLSGEPMNHLAVPLPFREEVQGRASVRLPRPLAVASPRAPFPAFVPAEMRRHLCGRTTTMPIWAAGWPMMTIMMMMSERAVSRGFPQVKWSAIRGIDGDKWPAL
jgi:hypothetical protein